MERGMEPTGSVLFFFRMVLEWFKYKYKIN